MNTTSLLKIQQWVELVKTPATGQTQLSHTSDSPLLFTNGYSVVKIVLFEPISSSDSQPDLMQCSYTIAHPPKWI